MYFESNSSSIQILNFGTYEKIICDLYMTIKVFLFLKKVCLFKIPWDQESILVEGGITLLWKKKLYWEWDSQFLHLSCLQSNTKRP